MLILQAEVDAIETAIEAVEAAIKESTKPASAPQSVLSGLQINHRKLQEEVESLYSSLNIPAAFPELNDIDYNFVTIMLKARDLKINIRKRAVGSFFEWERLDRAAGGRHQALGIYSKLYCFIRWLDKLFDRYSSSSADQGCYQETCTCSYECY